jgi:hypothetical protein
MNLLILCLSIQVVAKVVESPFGSHLSQDRIIPANLKPRILQQKGDSALGRRPMKDNGVLAAMQRPMHE